ncbi:MAG: T9SS type A sorting domain-containing protein [Bacteroidetes bacterium]|nr:T9SS type A sorting domain-containing protein [Bacteroidota bacterium]
MTFSFSIAQNSQTNPEGSVFNAITTDSIANVTIDITANQSDYSENVTSDLSTGNNWSTFHPIFYIGTVQVSLEAYQTDNCNNGVSTFDLLLLRKHILNTDPITDPFKLIAADANNSGTISTFDQVKLQQQILGQISCVPAGSWKFISAFHFDDPVFVSEFNSDPLDTTDPECLEYDDGTIVWEITQGTEVPDGWFDFNGIKIGDLNENASNNSFITSDDRSLSAISPQYSSNELQPGKTRLLFIVDDFRDISAFQSGMWLSPEHFRVLKAEAQDIPYFDEEAYAVSKETAGEMRVAWFDKMTGEEIKKEGKTSLFRVEVEVLKPVYSLNGLITLEDGILQNRFYNEQGEEQTPLLYILAEQVEEPAGVGQSAKNFPNPFQEITTVEFSLPQASTGFITIYDTFGKEVAVYSDTFEKGTNTFVLSDTKNLPAGNLFFVIHTDTGSLSGKMVKVQ